MTLVDGARLAARVEAVDEAGVDAVVERQATKGARVTRTPRRLDFAEITSAVVQVEFNRAADEAADEEDEDRGH